MNVVTITSPDVNNGDGTRVTCWVAGCTHNCPECHNEWLQNYKKGKPLSCFKDEIYDILSKSYIDGITFSGGDPLCQAEEDLKELEDFVKDIKKDFPTKNIWLYSGYTFKEAMSDLNKSRILNMCDYFVDGKFEKEKKGVDLAFRGSTNQNIWKNSGGNFYIIDDKIFKN